MNKMRSFETRPLSFFRVAMAAIFFMANCKLTHGTNATATIEEEKEEEDQLETWQHHHPATIVVLCFIYGMLSLTAFVGNVLVIWIICKHYHISISYQKF